MTVSADRFREGMRHLAASVTILTTRLPGGARVGMTATAVCSVSGEPPTLLCCINRDNATRQAFVDAGLYAVNVLGIGEQEIANRFARRMEREDRFEKGAWTVLETGAPILETATTAFDCRLVQTVEAGSHSIFFGEVVAVSTRPARLMPLLYAHGNYGGFSAPQLAPGEMFWAPDWQVYDQ